MGKRDPKDKAIVDAGPLQRVLPAGQALCRTHVGAPCPLPVWGTGVRSEGMWGEARRAGGTEIRWRNGAHHQKPGPHQTRGYPKHGAGCRRELGVGWGPTSTPKTPTDTQPMRQSPVPAWQHNRAEGPQPGHSGPDAGRGRGHSCECTGTRIAQETAFGASGTRKAGPGRWQHAICHFEGGGGGGGDPLRAWACPPRPIA